jgi:NADH:ubiquinone oxidoreductase subunit F (NADH-binding)
MKSFKENLVFNFDNHKCQNLREYLKDSGYLSLEKTLSDPAAKSLDEIKKSRLRGRGGAAFPVGIKLEAVRSSDSNEKYIICNADEGEPGTFKDRFIMTNIPFKLLEGLTIAAYLSGANQGYIYIRHEYPEVSKIISDCMQQAENAGLLGKNILNSGFDFNLKIFSGAGSYLCGEETALISSIEGKKGRPRLKPPYPTVEGLWGRPTLINNVETLTNLPYIIERGGDWFKSIGTKDSTGTKLISLSGDVVKRGVIEVPFGTTFREIICNFGQGMKNSKELKAVNIGGASGVLVPSDLLDTPLDYEKCRQAGITIGSGAVFVLDESRSILSNVRNRVDFFIHESCGKCTPCREGLRQVDVIIKKLTDGSASFEDISVLERYTRTIQNASFCGLGQAAGNSLASSLKYYKNEYLEMCREYKMLSEEAII